MDYFFWNESDREQVEKLAQDLLKTVQGKPLRIVHFALSKVEDWCKDDATVGHADTVEME